MQNIWGINQLKRENNDRRGQKKKGERDSDKTGRAAQGIKPVNSPLPAIAAVIDMAAQRRKLGSLFGGAIQRAEEEEPLRGKSKPIDAAAKSAPASSPIQRMKFSVKSINEEKRGERPDPGALLDSLIHSHPVFGDIWEAPDAKINLRVDYAGGKEHGGTKIVHNNGVTWFFITIYWAEGETYEEAAATFLHEALIHVLPGWQHHLEEREKGKLSNESFPDHARELETQEHSNVNLWVEAINAGKTINKGVVQELVQDAYHYLGNVGIVEVCKQINMPEQILSACLQGTFAPKARVEVVSKGEHSTTMEIKEDDLTQQHMMQKDNVVLLDRMEDAINIPWKAGSRFRVKGTNGYHCLVTEDHTPGQLLIQHLSYVFELL